MYKYIVHNHWIGSVVILLKSSRKSYSTAIKAHGTHFIDMLMLNGS